MVPDNYLSDDEGVQCDQNGLNDMCAELQGRLGWLVSDICHAHAGWEIERLGVQQLAGQIVPPGMLSCAQVFSSALCAGPGRRVLLVSEEAIFKAIKSMGCKT